MALTPTQVEWTEQAAQHLVRYEALFQLLDEIQELDDPAEISRRVATRWKFFASVSSWRVVIAVPESFLVVDGYRGEARLEETTTLSPWDEYHWKLQSPRRVSMEAPREGPPPPEHLARTTTTEIIVIPFVHTGRYGGLVSAATTHGEFSALDRRFIRLFGAHLLDRLGSILMRQKMIDELARMAAHDPLTGLLNHGTILDRLLSQLALAARTGEPLSVVLGDVDLFKSINDTRGHLAGDEVLREVARRVEKEMRAADSLGRFGGEEFLLVLYPCDEAEVVEVAERVRSAVAGTRIPVGAGHGDGVEVTISLGTGTASGQDGADAQTLIGAADEALYRSKAAGRNRVTVGRPLREVLR
jgi:diguanylate cyclase (GGDEF)-like protein